MCQTVFEFCENSNDSYFMDQKNIIVIIPIMWVKIIIVIITDIVRYGKKSYPHNVDNFIYSVDNFIISHQKPYNVVLKTTYTIIQNHNTKH